VILGCFFVFFCVLLSLPDFSCAVVSALFCLAYRDASRLRRVRAPFPLPLGETFHSVGSVRRSRGSTSSLPLAPFPLVLVRFPPHPPRGDSSPCFAGLVLLGVAGSPAFISLRPLPFFPLATLRLLFSLLFLQSRLVGDVCLLF